MIASHNYHNQRGLTLLETTLVLLVAAIIIGGIWLGYSEARLNQQVQRTIKVTDETVQITRDYLLSQSASNIPATLSTDMYTAGIMPPELSFSKYQTIAWNIAVFTSPLGGEFYVEPTQVPITCPPTCPLPPPQAVQREFDVVMNFNSADQCLRVAQNYIGKSSQMSSLGINSWTLYADSGTGDFVVGSTPVTTAVLETQCSGSAPFLTLRYAARP